MYFCLKTQQKRKRIYLFCLVIKKMQANKYYVVWRGYAPGIYDSWEEAEIQISGYPDASYRAFKTLEAATEAYREGFDKEGLIKELQRKMQAGTEIEFNPEGSTPKPAPSQPAMQAKAPTPQTAMQTKAPTPQPTKPPYLLDAIAVDAACSGNPGPMEYRGVLVRTGEVLFHVGPLQGGTNNIGEFLAIVHGMAMQEKQGTLLPLYSDSVNAQKWVRTGICKTQLTETPENARIFDMIRRAETWLRTHRYRVNVYKWETKLWGEIPADFGRK